MLAALKSYEPFASSSSLAFSLTDASNEVSTREHFPDDFLAVALLELWLSELETDGVQKWFKGGSIRATGV
jgi:hypothetical protein